MAVFSFGKSRSLMWSFCLVVILIVLAATAAIAATFITNQTGGDPAPLSPGWQFWATSDTVIGEAVCIEVHPVDDAGNYVRTQCSFDNTGSPPANWRCDVFTGGIPAAFEDSIVEYQFHIANFGTNCLTNAYLFTGFNWSFQMPLAVTLASFAAEAQADRVLVTWETASELGNRGFNLYRSDDAAGPLTLLAYLPSQAPGSTQGAAYRYEDLAAQPGQTLWYTLESISISGATTLYGPVSATVQAPTAVTLTGVSASPTAGAAGLPWLWAVAGAGVALGLSRLRQRR